MRHIFGSLFFASSLSLLTPGLDAQKVDFVKDVAPILAQRCVECHGDDDPEADLRLDIKAGLFPSRKDDWLIVPGKPKDEKNEFFYRISLPAGDDDIMPAEGKPLTKTQIDVIRRWIEQGAHWPDDGDAKIAAMLKEKKPKIETLDLPPLTAEQKAAEDKAIAAVEKAGGLAMRVAANTHATEVNLSLMGGKATNQLVTLAADLGNSLIRLNLARSKIDNTALETVGGMKQLRWLSLANTSITDGALRHLVGLQHLRYLNLYGSKVTDAGLAHLEGLKNLEKLYLWQTAATKNGAKKLKATLPNVEIDMGEYAEVLAKIKPPKKAPPAKASAKKAVVAINKKCPITGKPAVADKVSTFEGQAIGLCCGNCKKKFDKEPAKFIGKVKEFKKATGPIANKKCPVKGTKINKDQTVGFRGKVIGFCCGNCKAKFLKNPGAFLPKLSAVFAPAKKAPAKTKIGRRKPGKKSAGKQAAGPIANAKCPVSGQAIDPEHSSVFRRKRIGFCCEKCKAKFDKTPRKFLAKLTDVFPNAGKRGRNPKKKK